MLYQNIFIILQSKREKGRLFRSFSPLFSIGFQHLNKYSIFKDKQIYEKTNSLNIGITF